MNYELALKLKEAGFPQKSSQKSRLEEAGFVTLSDSVYIPSLSELIEACGDGFDGLLKRENGLWEAGITGGAIGYCYVDDNSSSIFGTGSTPEEAVAHLYLALNQK